MLFNTLQFAVFFIIVYSLYLVSNHRWQNRLLLLASYIFYGAWDWRFLSLIWISTVLDYFCGIIIDESGNIRKKRVFLFLSVFGNLSILGFFKYFDFFAVNLHDLMKLFNISLDPVFLKLVLPVGISFYTFQTMSYTIDIYYGQLKPTRKFFDFALFVAFFPQLVAGPIERAKHLLPQVLKKRDVTLDKFYEGCYLILWGLFLKVFVADNLAKIVDPVFSAGPPYNGVKVMIALYAFAFQIFGDFAGYSNIARGLGKCMGFDIMINFNLPYFSTNPSEFWRRWHISLSSWLRDYLYIPLGGSRKGSFITYRNLALTMLLGGLWHGAAWTFVIWGAYQGILLMVYRAFSPILKKIGEPSNIISRKVWRVLRVVLFFQLVCFGWLIFRAQYHGQIFEMTKSIFTNFHIEHGIGIKRDFIWLLFFILPLGIIQFFQFVKDDLMAVYKTNVLVKAAVYVIVAYLMIIYGVSGGNEFIYFQF